MEVKIEFERFFAVFFRIRLGNRCFRNYFLFFSSSNLDFCAHRRCFTAFSQNRQFLEKWKKTWILAPFSEVETQKNQEKIVLRNMCFSDIYFLAFFCEF